MRWRSEKVGGTVEDVRLVDENDADNDESDDLGDGEADVDRSGFSFVRISRDRSIRV